MQVQNTIAVGLIPLCKSRDTRKEYMLEGTGGLCHLRLRGFRNRGSRRERFAEHRQSGTGGFPCAAAHRRHFTAR